MEYRDSRNKRFDTETKICGPKKKKIYICCIVQYSVNLEYEKIYHLFLVSSIHYSIVQMLHNIFFVARSQISEHNIGNSVRFQYLRSKSVTIT